jgi:hypothetical protein
MADKEPPQSRQEKKGQGKFNKKHTDEKYNAKHVRSYERLMETKYNLLGKGWAKN